MKIAVRADASPATGSGHLMRCLALADALRSQGAQTHFLCSELPTHLEALVRDGGHLLSLLPDPGSSGKTGPSAEAPWTASAQATNARSTAAALAPHAPWDWLVVDHYGLGQAWEETVRPAAHGLFVLDDLGRCHDCDALLDANFLPGDADRYAGKVPASATLLLGPAYALLRPEFLAARRKVRPRRGAVRRLLVLLGGMDAGNTTGAVLQAVDAIGDPAMHVDVVIGAAHPARGQIEQLANASSLIRCHVQTDKVADLCAAADLAVGGGGGATWERCTLGLPTLALCLADNQRPILDAGARRGFLYVPNEPALDAPAIALHLRALLANDRLREHMSHTAMDLVDARGAERVSAFLLQRPVTMRRATRADSRMLHAWRNAPEVRQASRNTEFIPWAGHEQWLEGVLTDPSRMLLIGERAGLPVGVVRFDTEGGASAEISIHLAPRRQGHGDGSALLLAAQHWLRREHPGIARLEAEVLNDNEASHRLFGRAGFRRNTTRYAKRI